MGRPRKIIDEQALIQHAAIGYTLNELAAITGISHDTLTRRYASVIKRGRELRDASLRRKQFELARDGNPTMCIWLGKQYLGQSDKNETVARVEVTTFDATKLTEEQLTQARAIVESAYCGSDPR